VTVNQHTSHLKWKRIARSLVICSRGP